MRKVPVQQGSTPPATTNTTNTSSSSSSTTSGSVKLFVGVLSASHNRHKRNAVRATWGAHPALARVVFVMALPQSADVLRSIRAEAQQYQDIILTPVMEHYSNITHQTLEVFRSAYAFHGGITHVCKCDDDSYLHVDRMLHFLSDQPFRRSWAGALSHSYQPHRDPTSKWHVSREEWPEDVSDIKWSNGPGFVLSFDLVALLAAGGVAQCWPRPLFKLEDVAVGSWLTCLEHEQNITLHLANSANINVLGCDAADLVSHYMTPAQMRCMHAQGGACCPAAQQQLQQTRKV